MKNQKVHLHGPETRNWMNTNEVKDLYLTCDINLLFTLQLLYSTLLCSFVNHMHIKSSMHMNRPKKDLSWASLTCLSYAWLIINNCSKYCKCQHWLMIQEMINTLDQYVSIQMFTSPSAPTALKVVLITQLRELSPSKHQSPEVTHVDFGLPHCTVSQE